MARRSDRARFVDDIATLVRVACKRNQHIGMRLEPLGIAGQDCAILGTQIRPVEVEMDVFDILLELLLLAGGKRRRGGNFDIAHGTPSVVLAVSLFGNRVRSAFSCGKSGRYCIWRRTFVAE